MGDLERRGIIPGWGADGQLGSREGSLADQGGKRSAVSDSVAGGGLFGTFYLLHNGIGIGDTPAGD
jgi:hypothetical protein